MEKLRACVRSFSAISGKPRFNYGAHDLIGILGNTRFRCFYADNDGNLWISTYTNGMGLIGWSPDGDWMVFYSDDGLPSDKIVGHLSRNDGLTSDVILRIKEDRLRNVTWIVTSNSIQYLLH